MHYYSVCFALLSLVLCNVQKLCRDYSVADTNMGGVDHLGASAYSVISGLSEMQ